MDVFVAARQQLLSAFPVPSESYKSRLIVQIALSCILIIQCSTYLYFWVRDTRRAGKSCRILRLQRTQGGQIITTQALCIYVLCSLCEGVVQLVYRTQIYLHYYRSIAVQNIGILELLAVTFVGLGVLGYVFSNLNSTALLLRKSRTAEESGRIWVIFYNSLLLTAVLGWLGSILGISIDYTKSRNTIHNVSREILEHLDHIISDPTQVTPDVLSHLQSLQVSMTQAGDLFLSQTIQLTAFGAVYSSFFALASIISLLSVYRLRKHTRETRNALEGSGAPSTEYISRLDAIPSGASRPEALHVHAKASRKWTPRMDLTALERLVADLSLSVPLLSLVCLFYPIAGIISITNRNAPGWQWAEFRNDIFTWPGLIVPNIIVGYFMYNHWRSPGRYGRTMEEPSNLSGSGHLPNKGQPSFIAAHELHAIHPASYKYTDSRAAGNEKEIVEAPVLSEKGYWKECETGQPVRIHYLV